MSDGQGLVGSILSVLWTFLLSNQRKALKAACAALANVLTRHEVASYFATASVDTSIAVRMPDVDAGPVPSKWIVLSKHGGRSNGISVLLATIAAHYADQSVMEPACMALYNALGEAACQVAFAAAGGAELLHSDHIASLYPSTTPTGTLIKDILGRFDAT